MYNVYITDHVTGDIAPETAILEKLGARVTLINCSSVGDLIARAADAHAIMNTYFDPVNAEVMDAMPSLRVIVRYGIGVNTIDVPAARARGIQVANVPDYCLDEVSDHAVALLLTLARKTALSANKIKLNGDYSLDYARPMKPLRGMRVCIIGFGRIGARIARRLSAFGCDISYTDPYLSGEQAFEGGVARKLTLEEACSRADAIILQAPATKQNHHMLNDEAFKLMRNAPLIINTARGELIDTDALARALESGAVSGAGLDVIEGVPPLKREHPLLGFENVVLTPHSAWVSENSFLALQKLAAEEVARALNGSEVKSPVL